jgi:hypothetical protein
MAKQRTSDVPDQHTPGLCRDLAERARAKAEVQADVDLQQSYFELAADYEMLAQTLERIERKRGLLEQI